MIPKTSPYVKSYDGQIKWMHFLIKDDDLLGKYDTISDKVSADIWTEFGSEPFYKKEYLKTKIKSNCNEVTDFYGKNITKVGSNHTCFVVFSLDSALKKEDNYYLQEFWKGGKYIKEKVIRHVQNNLSDFSYSDDSDE